MTTNEKMPVPNCGGYALGWCKGCKNTNCPWRKGAKNEQD